MMTEIPSPALYQELDTSVPQIRLFTLLPSPERAAPLVGHLETVSLISPPPHEGLSYAWGDAHFIKPITINDQTLLITPNLDAALRALRLQEAPRVLWIDAICINQQSLSERGHQVTLMRTIYSHCERDLLWLGPRPDLKESPYNNPSEDDLGKGIQLLSRIADKDISLLGSMEYAWPLQDESEASSLLQNLKEKEREEGTSHDLTSRIKEVEQEMESHSDLEGAKESAGIESQQRNWLLSPEDQQALDSILDTPSVWSRVWVMQELSLAQEIQIVAGRHTLEWGVISRFLGDSPYADAFHGAFGHATVAPIVSKMFHTVQTIDHQRRIMKDVASGHSESKLMDVLARFRKTNSTDPRDKIYGLLGLVSKKVNIEVSYSISHQQLFTNLTASIINESGDLDIICQSAWNTFDTAHSSPGDDAQSLTGESYLPSWAADFSNHHGRVELFAQRSIFAAGRPHCEVPCVVTAENVLRTRGTALGKVGPILQNDHREADGLYSRFLRSNKLPIEWLQLYLGHEMISVPQSNHTYITGEPSFTAFWRTLIVDCEAYPIKRLTAAEIKEKDLAIRERWIEQMSDTTNSKTYSDPYDETKQCFPDQGMADMWRTNLYNGWSFSITENGLYVLLVGPVEQGDIIACLDGGKVPVVLRPVEEAEGGDERKYRLINVAYVHGFMDSEASESATLREKLGLTYKDFWLR